jgi:hypothetical protein
LTEFHRESAAKGQAAETTEPSLNEEFREQKNEGGKLQMTPTRKNQETSNIGHRSKRPQLRSKDEARTQNFTPLRSAEMKAEEGNDTDDTAERQ